MSATQLKTSQFISSNSKDQTITAGANEVLVYQERTGDTFVVPNGQVINTVDTASHPLKFRVESASSTATLPFQLSWTADYAVSDPVALVAQTGLATTEEAAAALRRVIVRKVAEVTGQFTPFAIAEARVALQSLQAREDLLGDLPFVLSNIDPSLQAHPTLNQWEPLDLVADVPTATRVAPFALRLQARYRVTDLAAAAAAGVLDLTDVETQVSRAILDVVGQVTELWNPHEFQQALTAIRERLQSGNLVGDLPVELAQIHVALDPNTKIAKHQEGSLEAQLERERARWSILAVVETTQARIDYLRPLLAGGMWSLLAHDLAHKPEGMDQVTNAILQIHQQQVATDLQTLQTLLSGDLIEDRHVREVVATLAQNLQRKLDGGPQWLTEGERPQPAEGERPQPAEGERPQPAADDLTILEGIGPKIAELLEQNGIHTFAQLADTSEEDLNTILRSGGSRFQMANPETWPRQARLAADRDWNKLDVLKAQLVAGVRRSHAVKTEEPPATRNQPLPKPDDEQRNDPKLEE